ncbi:Helicase associated domain protein [Candidatus Actinomarina]|nr:Helicase associated domain protein [Candidatus Actinomarina sp.]
MESKVWEFLSTDETDPIKRGHKFEKKYAKKYLEQHYLFSKLYKKVLCWDEWEDRPYKTDIGIDLVCFGYDEKITAVQAKAYNPNNTISKPDIDSFITASNSDLFSYRLLLGTTNKIGKNAKQIIINEKRIPFQTHLLTDLDDSEFIKICKSFKKIENEIVEFKPLPHQKSAINKTINHFKANHKGQLIMACGSGKTLTSLWITNKIKSQKVLFLAPSISLVAQTLQVWIKNNLNQNINFLVVCSDQTAGQVQSQDYISDYDFPSTTNSVEISDFMESNNSFVIFSTYQSSKIVMKEAKSNNINFDITICDEAHKLTGSVNEDFGSILNDDFPTSKKLFMTATPRILSYGIKKSANQRDIELISMDDKRVFGEIIYELTFGEAIEKKLLADYKIVVTGISNKDVNEKKFLKYDDKTIDISTYAKAHSLLKVLKKYRLTKAITFHSFIKSASVFSNLLRYMKLNANYISGKQNIRERKQLIKKLEIPSKDIEILSNARVLSEGIDLPELDAIAFIDPKTSVVDIVQAVGRAIRASKDKRKIGYVIIPIYLNDSSPFEVLYRTIIAMRSHDARMAEQLDNYRVQLGRGLDISNAKIPNLVIDLPSYVDKEIELNLVLETINSASETWYLWYGLLQKFVNENGHALVKQNQFQDGLNLGTWVSSQRVNYKKNKISSDKVDLLNAIEGWIWDVLQYQFEEGLFYINNYYKENKNYDVPVEHITKDGYNLGSWVRNIRKRKEIQSSQNLKKLKDINFTFETSFQKARIENMRALRNFYKQHGHWQIPSDYVTKSGVNLLQLERNTRTRKNKLTPEEIQYLSSDNFIWDTADAKFKKGIHFLQEYIEEFGHARVSFDYKSADGYNLGHWVRNVRIGKVIVTKDNKKILDELGFLWDLQGLDYHVNSSKSFTLGFEELKEYYKDEKNSRVHFNYINKNGYALGSWVSRQRRKYKTGKLTQQEINNLEKFKDWVWDAKLTNT